MERDFNNDFEVFLKQKADQYKVYPSERIWNNINNVLHSRRKWFLFGACLIAITGFFLINQESTPTINSHSSVKPKTSSSPFIVNPFIKPDKDIRSSVAYATQKNFSTNSVQPVKDVKPAQLLTNPTVSLQHTARKENLKLSAVVIPKYPLSDKIEIRSDPFTEVNTPTPSSVVEPEPASINGTSVNQKLVETEEHTTKIGGNWLQDLATIRLSQPKKSPFNLQFYFSPVVSYRRLADNKMESTINQQNTLLASRGSNINRYVNHSPSVGAELGSNILFAASKNFTIKSGLQLNYSRYGIKAYKSYFEKASIALNSVGSFADTLTSYTTLRNFGGYSPEQLQNQYLQVSVPIGMELTLIGHKNLRFNIAGTFQPSYLLFNDTYLLSTDYVNYAKEPSLVRKWNVHTSVEAFVSYKSGGVTWQFGPQFRYQLLSSYNERYPIKEYLMEYGVKVGVSKTIK